MKKSILFLLLSVLVLTGCSTTNAQLLETKEVSASQETNKPAFIMAGKVEAVEKADITTKIPGKVSDIKVEIGTSVKKGQALIVLDTNDINAQVSQAEAGVGTAKATLLKVKDGVRPEQIAQAKASFDSAEKSYEIEKSNYERTSQLFNDGVIPKQQLEASEKQLKVLEAQYVSAKSQLEMLSSGETKESLGVYEAQVKQAEAALKVAKAQQSNGTIISPISGTVTAKNINSGELAIAGSPLISIVNPDSIYINAYLPSRLSGEVKAGQKVIIRLSEIPDKLFDGEVTMVDPVVDPKSKSILVKVKLLGKDSSIKVGMIAEIALKK